MTIRTFLVFLCLISLMIMAVGCQSSRGRKPVGGMSSAPLTKAQRDTMNQWSSGVVQPAVPSSPATEAPAPKKRGNRQAQAVQPAPVPSAEPAVETPVGRKKNTPGYTTLVINNRETTPEAAPSKRPSRQERAADQAALAAKTAPEPAPVPEPARGKRQAKTPAPQPAALIQPAPASPASGLITEQDLAQAYQQFDVRYESSLGKTRKELKDLWGFPMTRLGDNGVEVAYGFRQRGVLNVVENPKTKGKVKKTSYYASGELDPANKGQNFACLVVLWIDKAGRGVVVDGEAVGDCFHAESLPQLPAKFER